MTKEQMEQAEKIACKILALDPRVAMTVATLTITGLLQHPRSRPFALLVMDGFREIVADAEKDNSAVELD